jgi:hypothetical protein
MGGPVTATGCTFVRNGVELRIEPIKDFKSCAAAAPLWRLRAAKGWVFRVREQMFAVRIKDREKARKVAELVAGSLF